MPHNLSVLVLDWRGKPVEGTEVNITIAGLFKGGPLRPAITDETGHAHLRTADDYESSRELTIEVRRKWFGPFEIGGGSYTVNV